jgi:hypothetical protein
MNKNQMLIRKIQLLPIGDAAQKAATRNTLYRWQQLCCQAANQIASHLYLQEQVKDFMYLKHGLRLRLADAAKDPQGLLDCSRPNSLYRMLSSTYKGQLPSDVMSSLVRRIMAGFAGHRKAYQQGLRSLSTYRRDIPIPFGIRCLKGLRYDADRKAFVFRLYGLDLMTYMGRGKDKATLLHEALEGKVKLRSGSLEIRKGKIYWLAVMEKALMPVSVPDASLVVEARLSMEHPIIARGRTGMKVIGNKEAYLYRRLAIQSACQRVQQAASAHRGGKGRKRKLKALERYRGYEKRYVSHCLHEYSRQLIDFCIAQGAGTLILCRHDEPESEDGFVLRNWSYGQLKRKIIYKAEVAGIAVIEEA